MNWSLPPSPSEGCKTATFQSHPGSTCQLPITLEVSFDLLKLRPPDRKADKFQNMAIACPSLSYPIRTKLRHSSKPDSIFILSTRMRHSNITSPTRTPEGTADSVAVYRVPDLDSEEIKRISEQTAERSSCQGLQRIGKGTAIVWFRNDLRVLDNEALYQAWTGSESVLPVYCLDPRLFRTTHFFGFQKTGGIVSSFSGFPIISIFYHFSSWKMTSVYRNYIATSVHIHAMKHIPVFDKLDERLVSYGGLWNDMLV